MTMRDPETRLFIDSNIVLYAMGDDREKMSVGMALLNFTPFISIQVINECTHVLVRKRKMPLAAIADLLEDILSVVHLWDTGLNEVRIAWKVGQRYGYSHYDSLIIASALTSNCQVLYSEDLQHGQVIDDRLRILNPFLAGVLP